MASLASCRLSRARPVAGKRGRIKSYESLLDEIEWSIREAQQVWRNAEICLIGHSMGGNLVLTYASERIESEQSDAPKDILPLIRFRQPKNVIAIAPMLKPYGPPMREDFLRVGCKLAKWLPHWPMRMNTKLEQLTNDASELNRYRLDRLVHRKMSIQLGIELLLKGQKLMSAEVLPKVPSLLLHGNGDRLADIEGSRSLSERTEMVKIHEVESDHHDLLSGTTRSLAYATIYRWSKHGALYATTHSAALAAA